jgi:shikimate dehydrogenase/3-dehydroquinate dehydratase type I
MGWPLLFQTLPSEHPRILYVHMLSMSPPSWVLVLILPAAPVICGFASMPTIFPREKLRTRHFASDKWIGADRNMFHDYDKAILVIGCSGPGGELRRVCDEFLAQNFPEQLENGEAAVTELSSSIDADGQLTFECDGVFDSVKQEKLGWPNIILVDFNHPSVSEDHHSEIIRKLYSEQNLLSIYINVHCEDSNMGEKIKELKARIETEVLIKYSDYELCIRDEGWSNLSATWDHINWEMSRLVARARLTPAIPGDTSRSENSARLLMGDHTFFLSLSFPEISEAEPYIEEMCQDVDAMEYRTDLLDCRDSRFDLIYGMQLLRRYCRPHVVRAPALAFGRSVVQDAMPIVYTVRTQNQAGTYPDNAEGINKMFELLILGLRSGSEVVDVESAWDSAKTDKLLSLAEKRYSSQILGSHHVVGKEVSIEEAVHLFDQCALKGRAHGAKVVLTIKSEDRDRMAYDAAAIATSLAASSGRPIIPNISLILGEVGQFSRVLNIPFTPVTHEALPFKAAPGQMTASEIMTTRILTNILQKRVFAILGHNIAYSVSPQMHGAAFGATRLPHKYVRVDVPTVEEFIESDFFQGDDFGGCSVTIPHKQAILPYLDILSDSVKAIGSCNTVIVRYEVDSEQNVMNRVIVGDNTDWKGIFNPLKRLLDGDVHSEVDYALIVGAGGTARAAAYVVCKLGLQRLYYNRTPEKARELEDSFGGLVIDSLDQHGRVNSLGEILAKKGGSVRVVISTLPAAASFKLPDWLFASSGSKPIVFDVNYKPYYTTLLRQAEGAGCDIVRGSEMLWEQGIGQFELWTGRSAPYGVMKQVVLENCMTSEEANKSN